MSFLGETVLSAFFQALFDKFSSSEFWDFAREKKVHDEIKKWEKMLKKIHLVLDDAEDKKIYNRLVKSWLSDLKDLAYDVEDVLDEFATECLQRKLKGEADQDTWPSKVRKLINVFHASLSPRAIMFNSEMMFKFREITNRLQEIVEMKRDLSLVENVRGASNKVWQRPPTACLPNEPFVYGRDEDKKKILDLLLRFDTGDAKVGVIPIVGMGGIGKTTLAQLVYNDKATLEYFDVKAWACVSDVYDIMRITKGILESITFHNCELKELNQVQVELHKILAGKRFLIVLDDIWNQNYDAWHNLRSPLMDGAPGSKVIVTTRNINIARMLGTIEYHEVKRMSDNDCWLLFARHAFENRSTVAHPNFEIIGRKIVETRCGGLPLAARTLGGLLRSKQREDEWEEILNNKIWRMQDGNNNIFLVLRLSYHYLPSHLKRCFAYCAIFPKDYEFEEKELILLWMAEGLIRQHGDQKEMEDLGSDYFRDLLSRSFFQATSRDLSRFVMHDLVNDLAELVAEETYLRLEDEMIVDEESRSKRTRHSSYIQGYYDGVKKFKPYCKMEHLRTFLPLSLRTYGQCYLANNVPSVLLQHLKCLRVLSFKRYKITELPESIGEMKHLRYLDLSHTEIESLPESTTSLCNLQTLMLNECYRVKKLPAKMENLISLRHLDIRGTVGLIEGIPLEIKELKALRTLSKFVVGFGSSITTLMSLDLLQGELCISSLENVVDASDARNANLKDKEYLDALQLVGGSNCNLDQDDINAIDVFDELQPHENLKELAIIKYSGIRFPSWLEYPIRRNLVVLRLENCRNCTSLPQLGLVASLKTLFIIGISGVQKVDQGFYGVNNSNPFPALEMLCFQCMEEWADWDPCGAEFPRLRELSIGKCSKLAGKLPNNLSSVEKLVIRECRKLRVTLPSLPMLSALEINGCKEVDCRNAVYWGSLNMLVLCNISVITSLAEEGFLHGLKKFKRLLVQEFGDDAFLIKEVPSSLPSSNTNNIDSFECMLMNNAKLMSLMVDEEKKYLQQELFNSDLEILTFGNIKKLPSWIHNLMFLRELTIANCPELDWFPEADLPPKLRAITIENCDALASLLDTLISRSWCLEVLDIMSCDSLISFGKRYLPSSLEILSISFCENLESLQLDEDDCSMTNLKGLSIAGCSKLTTLSYRGKLPTKLQYLYIWDCPKLEFIAESFEHNTYLEMIGIRDCSNLKCLPDCLHSLINLREISINECPCLVSFPRGGLPTTYLKELQIELCGKLEALPDSIHELTSLRVFRMYGCSRIVSFPKEGFPTNLTTLEIQNVKICEPLFEWGLHRLASLKDLQITGGCSNMVSFPHDEIGMMLPPSLTYLFIRDFPNLKFLSTNGFQNLTSLESLTLHSCPKLTSFPKEGLPSSLLQLYIIHCPLLEQRCRKGQGQEWLKIVHIPCILINS